MLQFHQPALLWLALLALPMVIAGWMALRDMDRLRRVTAIAIRALLLVALALILAGPHAVRTHDRLTVIGLIDISGSVRHFADLPAVDEPQRRSNLESLRQWFRLAAAEKQPDDRFGLVVFDGEAAALAAPTRGRHVDDNLDLPIIEGTNIAEAIRLGLALFPPDTSRRMVLLSDGNQTAGDAEEAARQAAAGGGRTSAEDAPTHAGVPIDVAPIGYRITRDVQIVRLETPATARPGQVVRLGILLEAAAPVSGLLTLFREGQLVDLNGEAPGTARRIDIPAGQSIQFADVLVMDTPINRFEAIFEPAEGEVDGLLANNRAEAFISTPAKGRVLLVHGPATPLADMLERAGIPLDSLPPERVPADPLALQAYDLVILDNISAAQLSPAQHELLARYVSDLGGGLLMIGGEQGFGAGGWNGSALEEVLPLEMDPPRELRLPSAALVLVLDKSGSMGRGVAGARASQQEIANQGAALAIESLRSESLVGVITFDFAPQVRVPLQRNDDPRAIADQVRSIVPEGGTAIVPALEAARDMLRGVDVQKKRVVLMTDGQSSMHGLDELVAGMNADGIRITTIAVGNDPDAAALEKIAADSGGEFYLVTNPATLPRVLIDSVQVINKPLIKEGPFTLVVQPTGSALTLGMSGAPPLTGLVITAPRSDPRMTVELTHPDGEPLLAHGQAGLGRVAAFTSDADGLWSAGWLDWPGAAVFWTQLVRTFSRAAVNQDAELIASIRDGRLVMRLETGGGEDSGMDYLTVEGVIYGPDLRASPVKLRQVGPGTYEGSHPAAQTGNYVIALAPRLGERRLAPVIGGVTQPQSLEYRRYESNLGLLERIVETTGGRRLDINAPLEADLFDRAGMAPSVSLLPAWRALLWLTLALVLLDVASRRIAWSGRGVQAALAGAVARVQPAEIRGRKAAATLATLRDVSAKTDLRREVDVGEDRSSADEVTPARAGNAGMEDASTRVQAAPIMPQARPAPDPARVAEALEALLGRSAPSRQIKPQEPPSAAASSPDDEKEVVSETTRSLLAAKRRAAQRLREERGERE